MATRTESRLGVAKSVGSTYTNVGTVAAATTWNLMVEATNLTASSVKVRIFVADSTWSTGLPTGSTLQHTVAYDVIVQAGQTLQIAGIIMLTGEKLVVYCDTASGADFAAMGVQIT